MAVYIPVPEIFASPSDRAHEPGAATHAVRTQAALLRSLLDELDLIAPPSTRTAAPSSGIAAQAVDELAQLAQRMMAALASIAPHRVGELCLDRGSIPPPSGELSET